MLQFSVVTTVHSLDAVHGCQHQAGIGIHA